MGAAARRTDPDAFTRELAEALEPLVAAVEDPQGLAVQAAQGMKVPHLLGAGHAALDDGDRHARAVLPQQAQVLHRARRLAHLDGQALLLQFLGVLLGIAEVGAVPAAAREDDLAGRRRLDEHHVRRDQRRQAKREDPDPGGELTRRRRLRAGRRRDRPR